MCQLGMIPATESNKHLLESFRANTSAMRGSGTPRYRNRAGGGTPLLRRNQRGRYIRNRGGGRGAGFLSGALKRVSKAGSKFVRKGVKRAAASAKRVIKTQGAALKKKAVRVAKRKGAVLKQRATRPAKGKMAGLKREAMGSSGKTSPLAKISASKIKKRSLKQLHVI